MSKSAMYFTRTSTASVHRLLLLFIGIFATVFLLLNIFLQKKHISNVIVPKTVEQINYKQQVFPPSDSIRQITNCKDKQLNRYLGFRGDYYVFYNYVAAEKSFKCDESVTYSAPGDFMFLDNIPNVVERWRGPVSVALYSPGEDFFSTLNAIAYLRVCGSVFVREFVTFHLFFDRDHVPTWESSLLNYIYKDQFDCDGGPPWVNINTTYRSENNLLFPINLARNIAKTSAQTHFIFPSDIELYPSDNLVKNFMNLIVSRPQLFSEKVKNVFVLPPFEVDRNYDTPKSKSELQKLLSIDAAFPFHTKICRLCHTVPKLEEWINHNDTRNLNVFWETKRQGYYFHWEPFYICTHKEPLWDERLFWEGQGDKMVQAYTLCLLDYKFLVLNNAFVVHKPGIRAVNKPAKKLVKNNNNILKTIATELQQIYGVNNKCYIKQTPETARKYKRKFTTKYTNSSIS